MTTRKPSARTIADEIRHLLRDEGSVEHATEVQRFFIDGTPPNTQQNCLFVAYRKITIRPNSPTLLE